MAARCTGVVGTFQYSAPQCKPQQQGDADNTDQTATRRPQEDDPQARCKEKGGIPDKLEDICPKCNDEITWVRRRIDVSSSLPTKSIPTCSYLKWLGLFSVTCIAQWPTWQPGKCLVHGFLRPNPELSHKGFLGGQSSLLFRVRQLLCWQKSLINIVFCLYFILLRILP